jgi:TolB-like protein/Flp pilus assembly protein TadD
MAQSRVGKLHSFLTELKHRRVIRVAVAYLIIAFGALQVVDVLVPALHLPLWTATLVVILSAAGLLIALGMAWAFDVGPDGISRTKNTNADLAAPFADDRSSTLTVLPGSEATPRVAVIPFLSLSSDPENDYFADGVTEDVIANLSKMRSLRVISRTSVMPYKQRGKNLQTIAAELGATTIVDGSVRRVGDRVRIVAKVIDAASDGHLWAETFDRQLHDIFAIQSEVALHIATALRAELSADERTRIRQEPTSSIEAYEIYLKGRSELIRFTPASMRHAIEHFERAIMVDPDYALAHASIAIAYLEMSDGGIISAQVARPRATSAAARALELAADLSEAHVADGYIKSLWEFDWAGAEAAFLRAIDLSPSNSDAYDFYGRLCSALGRFDEGVEFARRARELDPVTHLTDVANMLLRAGRYAEAEADAARVVAQAPLHDRAHATLAWALIHQRKYREGIAELKQAVALSPDNTQWLAQLGQAYATSGDEHNARAILHQLEEQARTKYVSPYHLSFVYTGLGEHDHAIDLLQQCVADGSGAVNGIKGSFLLAPLREHPRFRQLIARIESESSANQA